MRPIDPFISDLLSGCANRKTGVIGAVAGEQAPSDARILVGECDGGLGSTGARPLAAENNIDFAEFNRSSARQMVGRSGRGVLLIEAPRTIPIGGGRIVAQALDAGEENHTRSIAGRRRQRRLQALVASSQWRARYAASPSE